MIVLMLDLGPVRHLLLTFTWHFIVATLFALAPDEAMVDPSMAVAPA